jgi:hypothetical protein
MLRGLAGHENHSPLLCPSVCCMIQCHTGSIISLDGGSCIATARILTAETLLCKCGCHIHLSILQMLAAFKML